MQNKIDIAREKAKLIVQEHEKNEFFNQIFTAVDPLVTKGCQDFLWCLKLFSESKFEVPNSENIFLEMLDNFAILEKKSGKFFTAEFRQKWAELKGVENAE